jgi:hypothetical protein
VLEKASGQIKRVTGGVLQPTPVLDLAVNSNSERGLLSMVLDPGSRRRRSRRLVGREQHRRRLRRRERGSAPGQHVDRFIWNGTTLTFDRNLLNLRSRQTDNTAAPGHPARRTPPSRPTTTAVC